MTSSVEVVTFTVMGTPVPKGRPRWGNGRTYTPVATSCAETVVRAAWWHANGHRQPANGPVEVHLQAVFLPPATWPKWRRDAALNGSIRHTTRPDLDNIEKLILDALNGCAWRDDAQVFQVTKTKVYGPQAGVHVTLTLHPEQPTTRPRT